MPKIALLADIHGNLPALEAVLAEITAEGIERTVCLGDVASLGPQPNEVIARLRALGCPTVMGNTNAVLLAAQPAAGGDLSNEDFDRPGVTW